MANRKGITLHKDQIILQWDVQDACWKEFTNKDSKKAKEEIKEAFGRVSTVIVVSGVLLTVAAGLRWLLI